MESVNWRWADGHLMLTAAMCFPTKMSNASDNGWPMVSWLIADAHQCTQSGGKGGMVADWKRWAKVGVMGVSHSHVPEHPAPICQPCPAGCWMFMDWQTKYAHSCSVAVRNQSKYSEKIHGPFSSSGRTFPIIPQYSFIYLFTNSNFIYFQEMH